MLKNYLDVKSFASLRASESHIDVDDSKVQTVNVVFQSTTTESKVDAPVKYTNENSGTVLGYVKLLINKFD